jgi:hypothetical protein
MAANAAAAFGGAAAGLGVREAHVISLTAKVGDVIFNIKGDNAAAETYQIDKIARTARVVDENNVARGTRGAYAKLANVHKQLPRRADIVSQLVWGLPRAEQGQPASSLMFVVQLFYLSILHNRPRTTPKLPSMRLSCGSTSPA